MDSYKIHTNIYAILKGGELKKNKKTQEKTAKKRKAVALFYCL